MNTLPALDALLSFSEDHAEIISFLRAHRIGLITNHTGQTQDGKSTLNALRVLDIRVCALFSPEHGVAGKLEGEVASSQTDEGLPIHSLYGETRRPTPEMLADIDVLVFDIQDVGARFYTYGSTLCYALEECATHGKNLVVLDRPNPLGGIATEGPMLEMDCRSFVGHVQMPVVHGLTLGELALWHKQQENLDVDLRVVRCAGWKRDQLWPQTGLKWIAPSPNLPDFMSAQWYPSLCLLEFSGVAVGRGTIAPFQIVGAPWMQPHRVLDCLESWRGWNQLNVQAQTVEFMPTRAIYEGEACRGLRFSSADASQVVMTDLGLALLWVLRQSQPDEFTEKNLRASWQLVGSNRVLDCLENNDLEAALAVSREGLQQFREERAAILLYD